MDRAHHSKNADRERATAQLWYANNPDKVKQYNQRRRAKNPQRDIEHSRAWYAAHREQVLEQKRKQYIENPEPAKLRRKTYDLNHPERKREYTKSYRLKHRDEARVRGRMSQHRRRARKKAVVATFTRQNWEHCLGYWGNCCAYCGRPAGLWHFIAQDHFIALAKGGNYTPDNILPACHGIDGCNNAKRDHDPREWLEQRFGKLKAERIFTRIMNYFAGIGQN